MKRQKAYRLFALTIGGALLAGCGQTGNGPSNAEKDGAFALEAVSSIRHMASLQRGIALQAQKAKKMAPSASEEAKMKELLPSLDLFLENGFSMESDKIAGEFRIDGNAYSTKETISFEDINGESSSYSIYYNKMSERTQVDGRETETKASYKGIAAIGEGAYLSFESTFEEEFEEGERESEVSFTIYQDASNYVTVTESHEAENGKTETEFNYKSVLNGLVASEYSVEIEKEGTKDKVEYEMGEIEYELTRTQGPSGAYRYIVTYENEETDREVFAEYEKTVEADGSVDYVPLAK